MLCRFETLLPDPAKGDGKFVRMHGRRAGNGKQRLQRERKLKSIRDPASREVRSEFDQPRPRLTFVQQSTSRIWCIDLDQGSGRIPGRPDDER